jgi:large subunit ribosomal protein L13
VGSNPIGPAKIEFYRGTNLKLTEQTRSISRESGLRDRQWVVIDANERALGRVASRAASLLTGKTRPDYTPNQDTGDFVVIINAAKVRLTGSKLQGKVYYRHTEWPGGIRKTTAGKMLDAKPERLLEIAVKGMLPKNRLGHQIFNKLKVYRGAEHPHAAQKPKSVSV